MPHTCHTHATHMHPLLTRNERPPPTNGAEQGSGFSQAWRTAASTWTRCAKCGGLEQRAPCCGWEHEDEETRRKTKKQEGRRRKKTKSEVRVALSPPRAWHVPCGVRQTQPKGLQRRRPVRVKQSSQRPMGGGGAGRVQFDRGHRHVRFPQRQGVEPGEGEEGGRGGKKEGEERGGSRTK